MASFSRAYALSSADTVALSRRVPCTISPVFMATLTPGALRPSSVRAHDIALGFVHRPERSGTCASRLEPGLTKMRMCHDRSDGLLAELLDGMQILKERYLKDNIGYSQRCISDICALFETLGPRIWPDEPSDWPSFVRFEAPELIRRYSRSTDFIMLVHRLLMWSI